MTSAKLAMSDHCLLTVGRLSAVFPEAIATFKNLRAFFKWAFWCKVLVEANAFPNLKPCRNGKTSIEPKNHYTPKLKKQTHTFWLVNTPKLKKQTHTFWLVN